MASSRESSNCETDLDDREENDNTVISPKEDAWSSDQQLKDGKEKGEEQDLPAKEINRAKYEGLMQMIKLVRENPVVFSRGHEKSSIVDKRQVWNDIAVELKKTPNSIFRGMSGEEVNNKFKNLRDTYAANVRRLARGLFKSEQEITWPYFKPLAWLAPHLKITFEKKFRGRLPIAEGNSENQSPKKKRRHQLSMSILNDENESATQAIRNDLNITEAAGETIVQIAETPDTSSRVKSVPHKQSVQMLQLPLEGYVPTSQTDSDLQFASHLYTLLKDIKSARVKRDIQQKTLGKVYKALDDQDFEN